MGRAGAGGGSHHSSGGHSSSRSSGGHRVGSNRAGSSRSSSSSFSSSRTGGSYHSSHYHSGPSYYGSGSPYYGRSDTTFSVFMTVIVMIFVAAFLVAIISMALSDETFGAGTIERHKLETGNSYINDCIIDEIGWFDNVSNTESRLKYFWEETGVQPFIYLRAYDYSLTSDEAKEAWARDYYNRNFVTENVFLYVYFAEEDTDGEVGYMAYVNGKQASSIMDSEAVEIFWNYVDRYWYSDITTDSMFVKVFSYTADTIMRVSTTGKDIIKWLIIAGIVFTVGVVAVIIVKAKYKRSREKAEEDARILNTSINDLASDSLEGKYLK